MNKLVLAIFGLLCIVGCKEVFEKDISEDIPEMILPYNNSIVNENPVFFKWTELDGATMYKLQVVSPSFDSIVTYPIDSIVSSSEIYLNLDSNSYEVRLMAFNAGYETEFSQPIKFSLESGQSQVNNVHLISPANNAYDNSSFDHLFSWQTLTGATSYEFSIRSGNDFSTGGIVYQENQIAANSINISSQVTLTEGNYIWGVKAYNSNGETSFSTYQLNIDETNPNTPSLLTPNDGAFLTTGNSTFTWANGSDPGPINSDVISTIEIATDINFNTIIDSQPVLGETTDFNLNTVGQYYWRVYNDDEAGNSGPVSQIFSFTLN